MKSKLIDKKGKAKIDRRSIRLLTEYAASLPSTKSQNQKNGSYTPERAKLHKEIMDDFKKDIVCVESTKPIAILMGGSPGSGKSTFLRKYAPYLLKEEILKIDADEIRAKLPEYKGWNADVTHLETQDVVKTLLSDRTIGIPCKSDVIYDGTMNSSKKYLPFIALLKNLGYRIYVVYIDNVPKKEIEKRVLGRYQRSGRFVPLEVVDDFFSKGKTALNEIKKQVDGYMVIDGSSDNYEVIDEGGMTLPQNRQYGKIGRPLKVISPTEMKKGGKTDCGCDSPGWKHKKKAGGKVNQKVIIYPVFGMWQIDEPDGTGVKGDFESESDAVKYAKKNSLTIEKIHKKAKGGWIQKAQERMKKNGTIGAFTAQAKKKGKTAIEFAKSVLSTPEKYTKKTRQRAQFVKNTNPDKF